MSAEKQEVKKRDLRVLMPLFRLGLNDEEYAEFSAFCERVLDDERHRATRIKKNPQPKG
jgi:hypothetical protein